MEHGASSPKVERILVTGGSGFIGTNLIRALAPSAEVMNFDLLCPRDVDATAFWVRGDIRDPEQIRRRVAEFDPHVIVHLAARTDLHGSTVSDYSANTTGISNVIAAASNAASLDRVIFASSRLVFETTHRPRHDFDYRPSGPYGWSKMQGEAIALSWASKSIAKILVRPTSIWGPWFDVPFRDFFVSVRSGRYVHPGARELYKSYGYVGNTVHQIRSLMTAPARLVHSRVFWLMDYEPLGVRAWANEIRRQLGQPPVRTVPAGILQPVAAAGDIGKRLGWKDPPLTTFRLRNLRAQMTYVPGDLLDLAGPLPFTLRAGVSETLDWLRSHDPDWIV